MWGLPEGEEEEQELENLLEKHNERKIPNLLKKIDTQAQEAQSLKQVGSKEATQRHIVIKMPKVKLKIKRILKASGEKQRVTCKGVPIRLSVDLSKS